MAVPNLFIIGAHKCGTTSLYDMLRDHPDIDAPEPKEPGFFSMSPTIDDAGLAAYAATYADTDTGPRYRLDGSTSYSLTSRYPLTIERLRRHAGDDLRFIYLVRDPIARMRSAYVQLRSEGNNDLPRELSAALPRLIEPTWYHTHARAFADVWGDDRLFVATLEEFGRDPDAVLIRLQDFLGIDRVPLAPVHSNEEGERIQNSPMLDKVMAIPGVAPVANRLAKGRLAPALQRVRRRFSDPVSKPDLTPGMLGGEWPRLRDEAFAILEMAGADPADWPSLSGERHPAGT